MASELVKLAWADFESNAPETFKQLWHQQDFADVTLATEDGHQVMAHKLILSSSSQFFKDILLRNPHKNPLLYLLGIKRKELLQVLKYVYLGETDIEVEEVEAFLNVGKLLQIKGLLHDEPVHGDKDQETNQFLKDNYKEAASHRNSFLNNTVSEDIEEVNSKNMMEEKALLALKCDPLEEKKYECKVCEKEFSIRKSYMKHMNNHKRHETVLDNNKKLVAITSSNSEKNTEEKRIATINYRNDEKLFANISLDSETNIFYCDLCNYSANHRNIIGDHIYVFHEGNTYKCDQCEKTFNYRSGLGEHIRNQHSDVTFQCNGCDKQFKRKGHLKEHIEAVHDKVKHSCSLCKYESGRKDYLAQHIQSVHGGDPFTCSECDYKCEFKEQLSNHQKRYHGGIINKCDICDMSFKDRFELSHHKKSLH